MFSAELVKKWFLRLNFRTRRKRTRIRRLFDQCTNLSAIWAPESKNFVSDTLEQPHLPIRHTKFSKCKWLQLPPKSVTFLLIFVTYHPSSRLFNFYKLNFNCNFRACSDSIMAVQRRNTDRPTDRRTDRQTYLISIPGWTSLDNSRLAGI